MPCVVTVGGFYGDEGKGKIVAYLSIKDNYDIAARGGAGPNAGHTFVQNNKEFKVRMLPSAVLNKGTRLLIGAGVLIELNILLKEIETFSTTDRTFVDFQCGIIEKIHQDKDKNSDHLKKFIGTTGTGTGPANADRALRSLKLAKDFPEIALFLEDVSNSINHSIDNKEKVLIEGTQGTFLSLFHGTYPFVTSKDVSASAICAFTSGGSVLVKPPPPLLLGPPELLLLFPLLFPPDSSLGMPVFSSTFLSSDLSTALFTLSLTFFKSPCASPLDHSIRPAAMQTKYKHFFITSMFYY